jgi:hypothetical protein
VGLVHTQGPSAVPPASQDWTPWPPPAHAHASCSPGTHTNGAPPTPPDDELAIVETGGEALAPPAPEVPSTKIVVPHPAAVIPSKTSIRVCMRSGERRRGSSAIEDLGRRLARGWSRG